MCQLVNLRDEYNISSSDYKRKCRLSGQARFVGACHMALPYLTSQRLRGYYSPECEQLWADEKDKGSKFSSRHLKESVLPQQG